MVKEVGPAQLTRGYQRKPYFWLVSATEGVEFMAPVGGATTPNSDNPRSEIRQLYGNGEPAAWSNRNQTWEMECRLKFMEIPSSSDATRGCVGMQIHGGRDDVTVLRLEKNGKLYVTKDDNSHYDLIDGSYAFNTWMTMLVRAKRGGGIDWFRNGTLVSQVSGIYSGCYFKYGAYAQVGSGSTGRGRVRFTDADMRRVA